MVVADTSQTERIRILRARTLAIARRNTLQAAATSGFYGFELGPGGQTLAESIRSARALGQKSYTRPNAYPCGEVTKTTTVPPCCPPSEVILI
jgi:hypothetical protein